MPTQQSHTLPIPTRRNTSQNLPKRVSILSQGKFISILHSFRCLHFEVTQGRHKNSWTEAINILTGSVFTMTEDRWPVHIKGYAKNGGSVTSCANEYAGTSELYCQLLTTKSITIYLVDNCTPTFSDNKFNYAIQETHFIQSTKIKTHK